MKLKAIMLYPALAACLALMVSGCAYTNVQTPLDTNFDKTELGTKVGRSSIQSFLWMVAWGDGGTKAAAEDGDITTITHADMKHEVILFGAYTKSTTVVYGD